jgi:hypothetical protein
LHHSKGFYVRTTIAMVPFHRLPIDAPPWKAALPGIEENKFRVDIDTVESFCFSFFKSRIKYPLGFEGRLRSKTG